MEASGQLLSGIIRVGEAHKGWKTDYEYQITWSAVTHDTAVLHGLVSEGGFTYRHIAAIRAYMRKLGCFKFVRWIRYDDPEGLGRWVTMRV